MREKTEAPVAQARHSAPIATIGGESTLLASASRAAGHDLSRYAIAGYPGTAAGSIVQRVPLNDSGVQRELAKNAAIIGNAARSRVMIRWDTEHSDGNCHGWSLMGEIVHGDSLALLTAAVRGEGRVQGHEIAVFLDNTGAVAHSGRIIASGLEHVLIGLGMLHTTADRQDRFGYHERVNSVTDLHRLRDLRRPHQIEHVALTRLDVMRTAVQNAAAHHERSEDPAVHAVLDDIDGLEEAIRGKPFDVVIANTPAVKRLLQRVIVFITGLRPASGISVPSPGASFSSNGAAAFPAGRVNDLLAHLKTLIPVGDELGDA